VKTLIMLMLILGQARGQQRSQSEKKIEPNILTFSE